MSLCVGLKLKTHGESIYRVVKIERTCTDQCEKKNSQSRYLHVKGFCKLTLLGIS